jgi:Ca2+-transporting ATPase
VSKDIDRITEEVGLGDRHNMIFSGTAATYGHGKAVVVATGMQTQMGRIAGMLKEAPQEITPLQKELDRVGKLLGIIVVVIAVVMIATIIIVEDVSGFPAIFDVLILGVALAVAAVPEGLPAVVTAVLALGVQRMAKRTQRHRAASRGGRDPRLGERHRLGQDRHLDEERDDRARGSDGERARELDRHGLRARR